MSRPNDYDLLSEMTETVDTMPKCEECGMLATSEWKTQDDDGTYYTYRCEDHPETDRFWFEVPLYEEAS